MDDKVFASLPSHKKYYHFILNQFHMNSFCKKTLLLREQYFMICSTSTNHPLSNSVHRPSNTLCTWLYIPLVLFFKEAGYLPLNYDGGVYENLWQKKLSYLSGHLLSSSVFWLSLFLLSYALQECLLAPLLVLWCKELGVLTQGRWGNVWGCHKTADSKSEMIIVYYSKHNHNTRIGCILEGITEVCISRRDWGLLKCSDIVDYYSKLTN